MTRADSHLRLHQRIFLFAAVLACLIGARSNAVHARPRAQLPTWTAAYWLWAGAPARAATFRPDRLYVEVSGTRWPADVPDADRYVLVRRLEPSVALTDKLAAWLAADYADMRVSVTTRRVVGLQIDYDCGTNRLREYAAFLAALRAQLPPDASLSVTALLDWFHPGTNVRDVVNQVDEFVPQFYDTAPDRQSAGISAPIDPTRWAPTFEAFGVPYRIGIASFGRVARIRTDRSGHRDVRYFRDVSPLDLANRPAFAVSTRENESAEAIVRYDLSGPLAGLSNLQVGDAVEVTMPTEASVTKAIDAARQFGPMCAGVAVFRWPNRDEALSMPADRVRKLIARESPQREAQLSVADGHCVERRCVDLALDLDDAPAPQLLAIDADDAIELFLPSGTLATSQVSATRLVVRIPAHPGFGTVTIGRAISAHGLHVRLSQP